MGESDCFSSPKLNILNGKMSKPIIYTVLDIVKKLNYIFFAPIDEKIDTIVDKYNKKGYESLTESDIEILEEVYSFDFKRQLRGTKTKIIKCFIDKNDSILFIKKKIMVMLYPNIHYSKIHLFANSIAISHSLSKNIEAKMKSTRINEVLEYTERNGYKLYRKVCFSLGINYETDNGLKIIESNPLKYEEVLDSEERVTDVNYNTLDYYGNINETICMINYDNILDLKLDTETNLNMLRTFFPVYTKTELTSDMTELIINDIK